VGFSGLSDGNGTGAGTEGMKIAFKACGICKYVSIGPTYVNQSVGVSNQPATGSALVNLGTISAHSVYDSKETKHPQIQNQRGYEET
jgi:hypothetical protein